MNEDFFRTPAGRAGPADKTIPAVSPELSARAAGIVIGAIRMGRKVLVCGAGTAADCAQEVVDQLVASLDSKHAALPALALTTDHPRAPAFSRQVEALGRPGDVLLVFGTSDDVGDTLRAIEIAHVVGMLVIAFTDESNETIGRQLSPFDAEIRISEAMGARTQETFMFAASAICAVVNAAFIKPAHDPIKKFQADWTRLAELTSGLRPLVFTNGVFDILHRGHVDSLQKARAFGAYLVVGVNSDASVRRLGKGEDRPIQCDEDRVAVLAGLSSVDFVTIFDEDTPARLIETLAPDILVKGGDYRPDQIAGADFVRARGGRVETIPFVHDRSTTSLIRRIRTETFEKPAR